MNRALRRAAEKAEKALQRATKKDEIKTPSKAEGKARAMSAPTPTGTGASKLLCFLFDLPISTSNRKFLSFAFKKADHHHHLGASFLPENPACFESDCPLVQALIPHEVGNYYHENKHHNVPNCKFNNSNPPPFIWEAQAKADALRIEMNNMRHDLFHSGNPNRWVGVSEAQRDVEIAALRELEIKTRIAES